MSSQAQGQREMSNVIKKNYKNKHFEGSCELLSLNMILMQTSC